MSIKEFWEEECALCGTYHCGNYFCYNCLVRYAVEAGADEEKLRRKVDGFLREVQISDLEVRIGRVEKEPGKEVILEQMYTELRKLEGGVR